MSSAHWRRTKHNAAFTFSPRAGQAAHTHSTHHPGTASKGTQKYSGRGHTELGAESHHTHGALRWAQAGPGLPRPPEQSRARARRPAAPHPDALQHPDLLPFVQPEGHLPAAVAALAAPHAGGAAAGDASPPAPSSASPLPAPANIAGSHWRAAPGLPIAWRRTGGGPRGTTGAVVRRRQPGGGDVRARPARTRHIQSSLLRPADSPVLLLRPASGEYLCNSLGTFPITGVLKSAAWQSSVSWKMALKKPSPFIPKPRTRSLATQVFS